jgi:hypothetical protein
MLAAVAFQALMLLLSFPHGKALFFFLVLFHQAG